MPKPTGPSINSAVAQVAAQLVEPIAFGEFAQRVLAIKPSTAKDPKAAVRNDLSYHLLDHNLVYLDDRKQVLAPIQPMLPGVRFRHILSAVEADSGIMLLDRNNSAFLPGRAYDMPQTILALQIVDEAGKRIPIQPGSISERVPSFFDKKTHIVQHPGLQLTDWFLRHEVKAGDAILLTIESWNPPRWRLIHEPAAQRNETLIAERNQALADLLFARLEAANDESIYLRESILAAHLRLDEPTGYPGDPWPTVLGRDGRMRADDMHITYSDGRKSFFDCLLGDVLENGNEGQEEPKVLSVAEAQQVYRFKAEFTYRKSIWRRIEILGEQTLADLNHCLVHAFQHDNDHMGGFWRRIRRGQSNRFREVELGTVAPWGGSGENEGLQIAAIGLQPRDEIKFIYDFGDSHKHLLTLEAILPGPPAEEGVSISKPRKKKSESRYPRVVEQNQPKYKSCEACKKNGKETVATWVCHPCSNKEQREMVYCEQCASKFHEDHYTVELVY